MHATLDERADLVAQRDQLQREAHALARALDLEELPAVPTYEETQERADRQKRLLFLQDTCFGLQNDIDVLDRAARRAAAEREQIRAYATGQLTAARARFARVQYEEENLAPVITSLARRRDRVLEEIAGFEAQLRSIETPPSAPRPADPQRQPATALAQRARAAVTWSANPDDDNGES